jgi:hypothetical protein
MIILRWLNPTARRGAGALLAWINAGTRGLNVSPSPFQISQRSEIPSRTIFDVLTVLVGQLSKILQISDRRMPAGAINLSLDVGLREELHDHPDAPALGLSGGQHRCGSPQAL